MSRLIHGKGFKRLQPEPRVRITAKRVCRECGCTDEHACVDEHAGPCSWVEADLCSHCFHDLPDETCVRPRFTITGEIPR